MSGFLEKIKKEESAAYPHLIWNNYFYGNTEQVCDRNSIKNTQRKISFISTTLPYFDKDAFDILSEYVDFSRETIECYKHDILV